VPGGDAVVRAALLLLVLGVVLLAGSLLDARRRIVDLEERLVALELQQAMCARDASAAWLDHLAVTGELARLDATLEPGRCKWEMVPSRARQQIKDAVALTCSRRTPCRVSWSLGGG